MTGKVVNYFILLLFHNVHRIQHLIFPIYPRMARASSPDGVEDDSRSHIPLLTSREEEEPGLTGSDLLKRLFSSVNERRGLLWLLVAILSQATQVVTLTTVSRQMSAELALFFRSSFLLTMIVGVSWQRSDSNNIVDIGIFILNGISDLVFSYSIALAGKFISAGDASAISLNLPIPAAILACIFLKEPLDALDAIFVALNAIGLVIVSKPSWLFPDAIHVTNSSHNLMTGVVLAFCSLAGNVSATMCVRGLVYRDSEDAWLLSFTNGMVSMAASLCLAPLTSFWTPPETFYEWQGVFILGTCTIVTCLFYAKSLETEDVKTVSVLFTMAIPVTSCYDFFILKQPFDLAKVCGILLILGSTFAIYFKSLRISRHNNARR